MLERILKLEQELAETRAMLVRCVDLMERQIKIAEAQELRLNAMAAAVLKLQGIEIAPTP